MVKLNNKEQIIKFQALQLVCKYKITKNQELLCAKGDNFGKCNAQNCKVIKIIVK